MALVIKVLKLLFVAVCRLYTSGVNNHRNVFFLVLDFCVNFSPIFIWLFIFKNAGVIPHEWRPTIHVKLVYYADLYYYAFNLIGVACGVLTMGLGYLLYAGFFRVKTPVTSDPEFAPKPVFEIDNESNGEVDHHLTASTGHYADNSDNFEIDSNPDNEDHYQLQNLAGSAHKNELDFTNVATTKVKSARSETSSSASSSSNNNENDFVVDPVTDGNYTSLAKKKFNYSYPPGYSPVLIALLFALSWPILNLDFFFAQAEYITKSKDIFAWVLYVLCHLIVPIVTAVYLYVFHAPGALKYFSFILGCQNITGVLTHLLFPNAPPWFIHLNGTDIVPTYEMPGFAAGLTRVDVAMGTHLNSKGFHKSPIVFGAFPSLHSAMAVQVFLHLNHYSNWWVVKFAGLAFVVIQWWATIYLDHHFRLDLFAGMCYAYFYYIVFQGALFRNQRNFFNNYFFNKNIMGTNMGMRVFKGTPLEWFFDPYK